MGNGKKHTAPDAHTLVADLDEYWDAVLPDESHASLSLDGDHVTDEQHELVGLGADLLARAGRAGLALVAAAAALTPEDRGVVALLTAAIVDQKDLQTRRRELGLGSYPAPSSGVDLPLLAFPLHPDDIAVRALAHDSVQANRERAVLEAAQFQERDDAASPRSGWACKTWSTTRCRA